MTNPYTAPNMTAAMNMAARMSSKVKHISCQGSTVTRTLRVPSSRPNSTASRIPYSTVNGGAREISPFAFNRSAIRPKMPERKNFITTMTSVAKSSMWA